MENEIQEKICQTIVYLIPMVHRLQYLFQRWCLLDNEQKKYIDCEVLHVLGTRGRVFYTPFIRAFSAWEHYQDMEGATGFYTDTNAYRINTDLQDEITKILNLFEMNLNTIECDSSNFDENIDRHFRSVNLKIQRDNSPVQRSRSNTEEKLQTQIPIKKHARRRSV